MVAMKHEAAADRKFRHAIRRARLHMPAHLPAALFLTDPERTRDLMGTISRLPEDVGVVFRHFGAADAAKQAGALASICRAQGRTLLISADPALATAVGASGTHWPARLAPQIPTARRLFPGELNTMSVHSIAELRRARSTGADAILASTVFLSESPSAHTPFGPSRLAALTRMTDTPVYALGGVDAINAGHIARISGFASVSGFYDVYRR